MSQIKVERALDPRETGDVEMFYSNFDGIIQKNSGCNDCKFLTIDSYDPPCPVQAGTYTKIKLTDESVHITNIDKSFIEARCFFEIIFNPIEISNIIEKDSNIYVNYVDFYYK